MKLRRKWTWSCVVEKVMVQLQLGHPAVPLSGELNVTDWSVRSWINLCIIPVGEGSNQLKDLSLGLTPTHCPYHLEKKDFFWNIYQKKEVSSRRKCGRAVERSIRWYHLSKIPWLTSSADREKSAMAVEMTLGAHTAETVQPVRRHPALSTGCSSILSAVRSV